MQCSFVRLCYYYCLLHRSQNVLLQNQELVVFQYVYLIYGKTGLCVANNNILY